MQTAAGGIDVGQERRHLTVMFCDVVGSTGLSGRKDVESYFSILRAYYDACEPVVERHDGLIAQHQGDGIFLWFGYPEPREDDAIRAVHAGLDLLAVLRRLSADMESVAGEPLAVRMAAHAGEVLIAPVNGEKIPIAFGHTPNVAAKLQHSARPGSLLISDAVRRLTGDSFELEPAEPLHLADGSVLPAFDVVGARLTSRLDAGWRTPLVGREAEQQRLTEAWARAEQGGSSAILITGDRGIGRTRLASELAAVAAATDACLLDVACHQLDAGSAYRPFHSLVRQAASIQPDDPAIVAAARLKEHLIDRLGMDERAATVLGGVAGLAPELAGPAMDVDATRIGQLINELLVEWIGRLAADTPTVVLIDDVPAADPSSIGVLAQILSAAPARLFTLLTARADRAPPGLTGIGNVETIELKPLPEEAARALVEAIESPIDEARLRHVLALGDGIPLYLEELARDPSAASTTDALPITLTERLQARLRAPGIDREVLGALAAAGQDIEESLLAEVLGTSTEELTGRLEPLFAADLVARAGATATSVRIRHGLIAEASYAMLLQSQRARLHDRLATAMRDQRDRTIDWSVVGQHLRRAGRPLEAFEAILAGAEQARQAGAIAEALGAYAQGLEIVAVTDPSVRDVLEVRVRLERGIAAISARGFGADEAVEDFARCAELCRSMGPRPEHLSALSGVYAFYLLQGELARAREIAEDLLRWVDAGHADHRAENDGGFGVLSFYEGDYPASVEHLTRATEHSSVSIGGRTAEQNWLLPWDPLVVGLAHLAAALWLTGRPRAGQQAADRAMAHAASLPFPEGPFSMAYAKSFVAWTYGLGGHHEAAARLAREVGDIGARHGFAFWETAGQIHLALNEYRVNGRADAWDTVALHASIWELLRARVFLPYVLTAAAAVRGDMGYPAEAIAGFDNAGDLAARTGAMFFEAERLRLLAAVLPAEREDEAGALRLQAWTLAHDQGALVFELRAALDLARADGSDEHAARLQSAVDRFAVGAGYPEVNEARALLDRIASRA